MVVVVVVEVRGESAADEDNADGQDLYPPDNETPLKIKWRPRTKAKRGHVGESGGARVGLHQMGQSCGHI